MVAILVLFFLSALLIGVTNVKSLKLIGLSRDIKVYNNKNYKNMLFSSLKMSLDENSNAEDKKVLVGSKDYYKGFFERPLKDESSTRGDGLDQALKLGAGATIFLLFMVFLFLLSNGVFQRTN